MSGDILDTIDHVLADFEVSGDAMRWTPEPQPERAEIPGWTWADEEHTWGAGTPRFNGQNINGAIYFAPLGTPIGSPAWIPSGYVESDSHWWSAPNADEDLEGGWTTASLNEWKIELKVDWVNPNLVNLVMGPRYAYSHPIPLKGGSEYHRRRRNR